MKSGPVGHLAQGEAVLADLLVEHPPADLGGALLLLGVEPLPDLALGARGGDQVQPVAARVARRVGQHLHHVAVGERRAQRHQLAVDPRAGAVVAEVGVHPVGEVERRRAAREGEDLPLGGEDVDLVRIEVDLERGQERARVLHLLLPLQELPQPDDVGIARHAPRRAPPCSSSGRRSPPRRSRPSRGCGSAPRTAAPGPPPPSCAATGRGWAWASRCSP